MQGSLQFEVLLRLNVQTAGDDMEDIREKARLQIEAQLRRQLDGDWYFQRVACTGESYT
jgi:hypothetical protein